MRLNLHMYVSLNIWALSQYDYLPEVDGVAAFAVSLIADTNVCDVFVMRKFRAKIFTFFRRMAIFLR